MSTKSDDRYSGQVESQSEQDTTCEAVSADTRGGGKGSEDRVSTNIIAEVSGAGGIKVDRDYTTDTRGGGKGSQD
jgi:hypothetical protein